MVDNTDLDPKAFELWVTLRPKEREDLHDWFWEVFIRKSYSRGSPAMEKWLKETSEYAQTSRTKIGQDTVAEHIDRRLLRHVFPSALNEYPDLIAAKDRVEKIKRFEYTPKTL